jgi:copper chaperone
MEIKTLTLHGMSCGHCVASVEKAVKGVGAEGKVDLASKTVQLSFEPSHTSLKQIVEAIEEQGYEVV